jgi:hypothetical protein
MTLEAIPITVSAMTSHPTIVQTVMDLLAEYSPWLFSTAFLHWGQAHRHKVENHDWPDGDTPHDAAVVAQPDRTHAPVIGPRQLRYGRKTFMRGWTARRSDALRNGKITHCTIMSHRGIRHCPEQVACPSPRRPAWGQLTKRNK